MSKFTPGPWTKDYSGTIGHIKSMNAKNGTGWGCLPTPTVARFDIGLLPKDEEEANGELIADAPDLLDELQERSAIFGRIFVEAMQGNYSYLNDLAQSEEIEFEGGGPVWESALVRKHKGG